MNAKMIKFLTNIQIDSNEIFLDLQKSLVNFCILKLEYILKKILFS